MSEKPELTYVGDPLCSWCWGFAPSLRKLRETHPDRFSYRLLVGGLRTGANVQPLDSELKGYLTSAWQEVARRSGQPFDYAFLHRSDFVYDTEPSCRAVVAARGLAPGRAFEYNESLQDAFYRRGLDPTREETLLAVARELDLPDAEFREALGSDAVAKRTQADFEEARAMGVHGFPAVAVRDGDTLTGVTRGWLPPDLLLEALTPWLS